jgi:replicative DNA helicase
MVISDKEVRLEEARKHLLEALNDLRSSGKLTQKEADAVEAAIEDELIALRVGKILSAADSDRET